jgi:RHS repeat-associated protein
LKNASIDVTQKLPDLTPQIQSVKNSATNKGNIMNVTFKIVNTGYKLPKSNRLTAQIFAKRGYLRQNLNIFVITLVASGNTSETQQVALPSSLYGDLDIGIHLNDGRWMPETDYTNNVATSAIRIPDVRPSLEVEKLKTGGELHSGKNASLEWLVENRGISDISKQSWVDAVYFARQGQSRAQWINLARVYVAMSLSSGKTYTIKKKVVIPESVSGWGFIIIQPNDNKGIVAKSPKESYRMSVQVGMPATPDLVPIKITTMQETFGGTRFVTVNWEVENKGNSFAGEITWKDVVTVRKGNRKLQKSRDVSANLNALAQYQQSLKMILPAGMSGLVSVSVNVDAADSITEYQTEDNNEKSAYVTVPEITKPSLSIPDIDASVPTLAGERFNLTYKVENKGADMPSSSWQDGVFFYSGDTPTSQNIMNDGVLLATVDQSRTLASGESYSQRVEVAIPPDTAGDGKLYIVTRLGDVRNGQQDVQVTPGTLKFNVKPMPLPDLQTVMLPNSFSIETEQPFFHSYTIKNSGKGRTLRPWWDKIYLSKDTTPDPFDKVLKSLPSKKLLGTNETYAQSVEVRIPSTVVSGQYYLLVETGVNLIEGTKDGNIAWKPTLVKQLPPSDLQVVSVTADRTDLVAGQEFNLEWTLANAGIEKAHGYKCDNQYLSRNRKWEIEDDELKSPICGRFEFEPFQAKNKTYKYGSKNRVPFTTVGQYYGLVTVRSNVYDVNLSNNHDTTVALSVSTPGLKLGIMEKVTMTGTQDRMYRIAKVPDEAVLIVELTGPANGAFHNLYLKKDDMPTSGDYGVRSDQPFSVSQTIVFANSAPGDFYLLVTRTAEKKPYEIQLLAKLAEFEIHKVKPLKVALADYVTFTVNGALFSKNMKASLVGSNGEILPTRVSVSSISKAYVTFALDSQKPGDYRLQLIETSTGKTIKSNEIVTLAATLTPGELSVQFNSGRALRVGETGVLDLVVQNTGNSDVPSPVFLLSAQTGGTFTPMFQESVQDRNEWIFLAPTADDYMRSLTAGSMKKYSFSLPSPSMPTKLELKLLLISESNYNTVEERLMSDLRETRKDLDDIRWEALWSRFLSVYGNNFESWKNHILDVVSEQIKFNRKEYDVNGILQFLLNLADGFVTDKLMDENTDIWEPTVPDILLTRKYSLRESVTSKVGYFGLGWTTTLLDFELLETGENVIGLLIKKFPVFLSKISENLYTGQGYSASVNGTQIIVTSAADNVKYVISVNTKKVTKVLFRNRHLTYINKDTSIEVLDVDMNRLILSFVSHAGHTLCQKSVLQTKEGKLLHSVDYEYDPNSPRLLSVTGGGKAVHFTYHSSHGNLHEIKYGNQWRDVFEYDSEKVLNSLEKRNPGGDVVQKTGFKATKFGTLLSTASDVTSRTVFDITGRQIAFYSSDEAVPFFWESTPGGNGFRLRLGDEVLQSGSQKGAKVTGINANRGRSSTTATSDGSLEIQDASNNVFRMEFDKDERLMKYGFPDGTSESYSYYNSGLMSEAVARDGTTTFLSYDNRGRLDNVTLPDGFLFTEYIDSDKGNTVRQLANQDDIVNIEYDEHSQPVKVQHSDGHVVRYTWNELRQVTSIKTNNYSVSYQYNSHGKLVLMKDELTGSRLGHFEYDKSGPLRKKTLGNGDSTTYVYDTVTRRIKSLKNFYKNGTVASYFNITYNRKGQRTRMETKAGVWTYTYDAGGQITSWIEPTGDVTNIDYDKVLNRLVVTKGKQTTTYKHNKLSQMTNVLTLKLQYDKNGNLVYKENADGSRLRMRFNSINQIVWLDNETYSCDFAYDPFGALMKHNCSDGSSTRYLSDYLAPYGYNILARISGGKQDNFYHALALGLLSGNDGVASYFYHFDPDLSTTAITDGQSRLLNSYKYSPFGEDLEAVEQWFRNPFRHRGQLGVLQLPGSRDKYIARARIYDPKMGRFISMDPFHHGRQGTTNSYAYCNNNPIECKDPNGEWLQFIGAAALIGGVANTIATTGWSVYQGMSNGKGFTESLPSLGNVAGSFVAGAITGASIAGGNLPGALAGTSLVGGFIGGAAGTALTNAIDGQPQNLGSILYNGLLNGLGAKYLPPNFIGPYSQHLNNIGRDSFLHWITRNSFKESLKRFWKPFALTFEIGSALGIFGSNALDWLWNAFNEWVRSRDPNDIIGPPGFGELKFIPQDLVGRYKIRFENVENASAPAQSVVIKTEISDSVELRTFRLGPVGFGDTELELDYSKAMHRSALDLSRSRSYAVRIQAGIDVIERTAWWELTTVNASTGELIPDPLIGFLPPNNNASEGEGYVTYEIGLKPSLPHMTKVKAKAAIVFDQNEVIETPEIFNTIDATKPSSSLVVQKNMSDPVLQVESRDTGASVKTVNIYRLTADGKLNPFLQNLESNTAILLQDLPAHESNMRLISIASDHVGNVEQKAVTAASLTTVSVTKSKVECPANCSGNGNCSSSGICNCNQGFVGLNCSKKGSSAEPPVLIFWVASSTNGTANGFIGYRLLSKGSFGLQEVKLMNISRGIKWTEKGKVDKSDVILGPGEVGNFTLAVYCHSHVGWHEISARYTFKPSVSRQYIVARFYVTHEDCKTTVPPPTKVPTIIVPTGAGRNRPEVIILVSLFAAMFHYWF